MSSPATTDSPVSSDRPRPRGGARADRLGFGVGAAMRRLDGPPAGPPRGGTGVGGLDRWLARRLLRAIGNPPLDLSCGMGRRLAAAARAGPVVLHDRPTLWKLALRPALHFGDAYAAGRLEVEGDLARTARGRVSGGTVSTSGAAARDLRAAGSAAPLQHRGRLAGEYPPPLRHRRRLLPALARRADALHVRLFCHPRGHAGSGAAGQNGLRLPQGVAAAGRVGGRGGLRLGPLALHMARHYGVRVRAYNVSREQIQYARQRARTEGLDDRVEFVDDDYRNIRGQFDVFVSVGMLEHVGPEHYGEFAATLDRSLGPAGRGLIHFIGRDQPGWVNSWIERRIFPGAYAPTLREVTAFLEPRAFSVLDVENLGLHYAETLRHWLLRFDAAAAGVARMFDEAFVRAWRLYLTGSMAAFNAGALQLFQLVLARSGASDIPRTRRPALRGGGSGDLGS